MAPIVPGLTSQPAKLERTIKAIADHGAPFMGANLLYLKDGTRTHFMAFLEKTFPGLAEKYPRLYRGAYARDEYAKEVRAIVKLLQERHRVPKRGETETPVDDGSPGVSEQNAFVW
jgi:DNA repair photolyase